MRLIFIYGPPAVGKYSIGRIIAHQSGYKLFHNHLTVDVAKAVFPENSPARSLLLRRLRLITLTTAARANQSMIFTFAYAGKPDDHFVSQVVQQVERYGGQVDFVQLTASENDLRQRVTHQQRVHMGKIHTVRDLNGFLTDRDIRATVPFSNNFVVNTSEHSLQTAAELIIHQYQLKPA